MRQKRTSSSRAFRESSIWAADLMCDRGTSTSMHVRFHKPDLVADILDLPMLPSDHYDEILAQDVLEHLPRWATRRALCEWNRLLTPAGALTIRTTNVLGVCSALADPGNQSPARQESLLQCIFRHPALQRRYSFHRLHRTAAAGILDDRGFHSPGSRGQRRLVV